MTRQVLRLFGATATLGLLLATELPGQVRFERTGYRLTSIGERVSARVLSSRGARVPAEQVKWRVSDPTVASVNQRGELTSRRAGFTRIWAVRGSDSSSAIVLVDQWAARFDFYPAVVRLDAVGAKQSVRIMMRDASGHAIPDAQRRVNACRSVNDGIATLSPSGEVSARANGVTYIRCTDRGHADSVRIEVRQRPARVNIADKLSYGSRVVDDTFRLRVNAIDPRGDEIRNVQATWASMNPMIVSVDPSTGISRAINAGQVKIVAQVGDATDTVSVNVLPGSGLPRIAMDTVATNILDAPAAPTLHLLSLFLTVGDTARVTARDAAGIAISSSDFRIFSNDTARFVTLSGQRVIAKSSGNAYVVAQYGGIIDSALVSIREKGTGPRTLTAVVTRFVRPRYNVDSATGANRARLDSAAREIQRQSVVPLATGRIASLSALAAHGAHSTRDTNFLERRTGIMYGGTAVIAPNKRFRLTADFRTGQLSPTGGTGEDMSVTEVEASLLISPLEWLGLSGGYGVRNTRTDIASQRWTIPRASVATRFPFVGGMITSVTGLSLLPGATYSGHIDTQGEAIDPNPFSLAGEAGFELNSGRLSAALMYYVERFTFPKQNNNTDGRADQFSALRLRLGLQAGR